MAKYYYTSVEDKKLIEQSFINVLWLVFGKKNPNDIRKFANFFDSEVKQINVFPQGTVTEYLNRTTPGICRLDSQSEKIIIEMLGYSRSNSSQHSIIKHNGTHEFCHAFADLLPKLFSKQPNGIVKNGIRCKNCMGMIEETDPKSGKLVEQNYYGKLFNETMMDIITSISVNAFDSSHNNKTADDILRTQHAQWNSAKTSYSIFTSLTRLTIAAFSNCGFINYQNIINSGNGIFNVNVKMSNGQSYKANDFLYGILFDPLHIEQEFDKFMGDGYYRIFCEYLDRLFVKFINNQEIPSEEVKRVMNILPNFLNKKINFYKQNGIIDPNNANQIIANFNQIWNSMKREYSVYFSQTDIDEIAKKARRK